MNSSSSAVGLSSCPPPFLPLANFPYVSGQKDGRFCAPSPLDPMVQCCLPCPLTDWVYPDNFNTISYVASWVGVGSLACCVALLLSFAFLPAARTSRHYLTICLLIGIFFLELAFIVPLGTKPNQCFDEITPNDLHSDVSCAITGIFLLGGGFGSVMWVFIRSLSVHLQICWKIVPGSTYFYLSQLGGWGLTALFLALSLTLSGVSYRLGTTCHINHTNSIATFWGPLLGFAGLSLIIQLATFAYCVKVYVQVAHGPKGLPSTTDASTVYTASGAGTASGSGNSTTSTRATYRRVRKVVALQWRGMTVVLIVIISACYLAAAFLLLDSDVSRVAQNYDLILPWVKCLALKPKDQCLDLTAPFIVREQIVLPVLYLISIIGFWALLFLGKWDMVTGWIELVSNVFRFCGCCGGRRSPHTSGDLSPNLHGQNQEESFSDRLRATPQKLYIRKDERGLSVANKAHEASPATEAFALEMMRSPSSSLAAAHNQGSDYFSGGVSNSKDIESSAAYSGSGNTQSQTLSSAYNYSYSNSSAVINNANRGHAPSQLSHSQSMQSGSQQRSSATGSGSRSGSGAGAYVQAQPMPPPPPTSFEGVWAAPPPRAHHQPRGSFNFSRPSTAQGPTTAAYLPHTYTQRPLVPYHNQNPNAIIDHHHQNYNLYTEQHPSSLDVQRNNSTTSAGGWTTHHTTTAEDWEDDTVPLSPVLLPAPPSRHMGGASDGTTDTRPGPRPRAYTDSRASSIYSTFSFFGLGGGGGGDRVHQGYNASDRTQQPAPRTGRTQPPFSPQAYVASEHPSATNNSSQEVLPPQRPSSRASNRDRPSQGMAWDHQNQEGVYMVPVPPVPVQSPLASPYARDGAVSAQGGGYGQAYGARAASPALGGGGRSRAVTGGRW